MCLLIKYACMRAVSTEIRTRRFVTSVVFNDSKPFLMWVHACMRARGWGIWVWVDGFWEHPVRESENARHGKPRTPGQGNREHPVRVTENTWPDQSSEDTRSPDPSAFRLSRCSIYTRNFARYFPSPFDNSAAPRTDTPKREKKEIESEIEGKKEHTYRSNIYLSNGLPLQIKQRKVFEGYILQIGSKCRTML